jgi:hypothetical protein
MQKLWNLISIVAIVNLLAVLGFGGWLFMSGRVDGDRFRALMAAPEPPAEPEPEALPAEPEADLTPTSVKIDSGERQLRAEAMSVRRLQEEKQQLDRVLDARERKLTEDLAAFQAEKSAWESSMEGTKAAKTDEQFRKAVKLLENVPAKQAKEWILELVRSGEPDQAVAYLDAMSSFKATGLLKAFKGEEEQKVATDLLERLRQRTPRAPLPPSAGGTDAPAAESAPNAAAPASNPAAPVPNAAAPAAPAGGQRPANEPPLRPGQPIANGGASVDGPGNEKPGAGN